MALSLPTTLQINIKMKKLLKISLLTVGIALSSSLMAQEAIKKDAATAADKLETPKSADTKADKQEPVKTAPAPAGGASKTESKSDTSSGTRMAITEQGVPKRSKNKGKKVGSGASTTPTPATKAEEPPKK